MTAKPSFDARAVERLLALQKETFGDKVLPGDSAQFIREARESRPAP